MTEERHSSEEDFYTDVDEDLQLLENELLHAKPELRRNPPRNVKLSTKNKSSSAGKTKGNQLPDDFLRINKAKESENMNDKSDETDIVEAMGNTVVDIKEDVLGLNNKLTRMLTLMRQFSGKIQSLETKIVQQEVIIKRQDKEIQQLYTKCDSNERMIRSDKVIMSSPKINTDTDNYHEGVKNILHDALTLSQTTTDQITISRFGSTNNVVLLQLPSIAVKLNIFRAKKLLRGNKTYENLFINEFLSEKNAAIMKAARELKKKKQLYSVFSFDGRVYVKKRENDDRHLIQNLSQLQTQGGSDQPDQS